MEIERPRAPTPTLVLAASVQLVENLRPQMTPAEMVDELALVLRRLLPKRELVIRIAASDEAAEVSYVHSSPALEPFARKTLWVTEEALLHLSIPPVDAIAGGLCVIEAYEPELNRDGLGFDVPIYDGELIRGVIGIEYAADVIPVMGDPVIVAQLALHLGASLRDARGEDVGSLVTETEPPDRLSQLAERTRHVSIPPPPNEKNSQDRQVIQVEKLATLGKLAAGIVHELNNPLTSISMYSQYLARNASSGRRTKNERDVIARIEQAAERVQRLTRNLMGYARPASEEMRPLAIERVMDRALLFCAHVLRSSKVEIERKGMTGLPLVDGAEGPLQQVFINLLTNAGHAMTESGGNVEVQTKLLDCGHVEVRIVDDGPGIPSELRETIFEPFFSTKDEGAGTGLGLSIVRTIIEQHHGTIHVEPTPGGGATFVLRLPSRGGRTGTVLPPSL